MEEVKKDTVKITSIPFSAVFQQAFQFAVFPKQLITFNPMQYIKLKNSEDVDLFSDDEVEDKAYSLFPLKIMGD